jgi:hypothetical protein
MLLTQARADAYRTRMGKTDKAIMLYGSILEQSKVLERLDFSEWNLPRQYRERYDLQFEMLPPPARDALPLQELITSTLVNLSILDIDQSLGYINESMDDDMSRSWKRIEHCREGSIYALVQILPVHKDLVMENIASLIPRRISPEVIFEIARRLSDNSLASLYHAYGTLISYSA